MGTNNGQISITLLREELIYDIQFEAWKISKTHIDNKTMQAEIHVNMEADDWIERQIQTAIDRIYGKLARTIPEENSSLTDQLDEAKEPESEEATVRPSQYVIPMTLDSKWIISTRAIRSWFHKSVTNYVLFEWFSLVLPDKAAEYLVKSDKALDDANRACGTTTLNMTFRL